MFSDSERDRLKKLGLMYETALERSGFNRPEARRLMSGWLAADRYFDGVDKDRLAKRVEECRYSGARLDLDDPRLRGAEPRPLTRDTHW